MKQLEARDKLLEQSKPTRWARFKDAISSHPETTAYATFAAASVAATASAQSSPHLSSLFGIAMASIPATCIAFSRESKHMFKSFMTKADRIVSSAVADVGFAAGSALLFIDKLQNLGMATISVSMLASFSYKPVKDILLHPTATAGQKAGLIASGMGVVTGMLTACLGMSEGGVNLVVNLSQSPTMRGVTDIIVGLAGVAVAAIGATSYKSICEGLARQKS